jgi:hypothetical protein
MYTILSDNFIKNEHILNGLIYIIYIMISICVCILIAYSFLLSMGIIKGTVLSSKCDVESVEYESIRYQIYKIFEYFDKPSIVVFLLIFIGFIICIALINIIQPMNNNYINIKFGCIITFYSLLFYNYNYEKGDWMKRIIYMCSIFAFMIAIKLSSGDIRNIVLFLIFCGLLYFNYTIFHLFRIRDHTEDNTIDIEFLKVILLNICIILILIYLLKGDTCDDEVDIIKRYFAGITVISICSILFITLLHIINIFGYNFKVKYEKKIKNLNDNFGY